MFASERMRVIVAKVDNSVVENWRGASDSVMICGIGFTLKMNIFLLIFIILLRIRSEEHASELQSPCNLVCRLLLEKKKKQHDCTQAPRESHFIIDGSLGVRQITPLSDTPCILLDLSQACSTRVNAG